MTITADSWIHGAPVQWTRGRIKNLIASASNGTWGGDPAEDGSDVRCIRAADFDRVGRRVKIDGAPLRTIEASSLRQHLLRPGDLILEKSGGGEKQPVGMAVLYQETEKAVCSNFCARISPATHVDPRFLTYVFAAAYGQGLTQSAIKQTTGIQNLDAGTFFSSAWAYPELEEQRRIAEFLDSETAHMDGLICATERQQKLVMERQSVAFHDSVQGEGGPDLNVIEPETSNAEWRMLPLNHALNQLTNGYVGPTRDLFTDDGVRYLQSLHIKNGRIDFARKPYFVKQEWAEGRPRIRLGFEDLLIVQTGAIGEVALVDDEYVGASCHALLIARTNRSTLAPRYLWHAFRSHWGRNALLREQTGALHPHLEA